MLVEPSSRGGARLVRGARTEGRVVFLRNSWYVAAWEQDVGRTPLQRWIVGEPIVLYRTEDGAAVALADRCAHRRYPLSAGQLLGDCIQCGYHGFVYDPDGACVEVPGQRNIPSRARVRRYQVVEKDTLVWLWPGDPSLADESTIPEVPWLRDGSIDVVRGTFEAGCRWTLYAENLLDLTHLSFIHPIGARPGMFETPIQVTTEDRTVRFIRDIRDDECSPLYRFWGYDTPIHSYADSRLVVPSLFESIQTITQGGDGPPKENTQWVMHSVTPSTATTTFDCLALAADVPGFSFTDDPGGKVIINRPEVVDQDFRALELQEQMVASDDPEAFEINVRADSAVVQFRRLVRELAASEAAQQHEMSRPVG